MEGSIPNVIGGKQRKARREAGRVPVSNFKLATSLDSEDLT
jgi:hypothetical protein